MKREYITHLSFMLGFLALMTMVRGWFNFSYLPLWFGGVVGVILPDVDHLIYVYFRNPAASSSRQIASAIGQRDFKGSLNLIYNSYGEREELIFHSALFQIVFLLFAFLVITSSGSLLGRGLVLGFVMHILVDQFKDLLDFGNLNKWFKRVSVKLDREKALFYWIVNLILVLLLGFWF